MTKQDFEYLKNSIAVVDSNLISLNQMEHTAYLKAYKFLKDHEMIYKDKNYPSQLITIEDAARAIRLALSTHTKLLNGEEVDFKETEE